MTMKSILHRSVMLVFVPSVIFVYLVFAIGRSDVNVRNVDEAIIRIEKEAVLRRKFEVAQESIVKIGLDKIVSDLEKRNVATESEQILVIQAGINGDLRTIPMLQRIADSDGTLSRYACGALNHLGAPIK